MIAIVPHEVDEEGNFYVRLLTEFGKHLTRWIPVEERLPEERIRVLTTDGQIVQEGFYGKGSHSGCYKWDEVMWRENHGQEKPFSNLDGDVMYTRTHWMDLPTSPHLLFSDDK